MHTEAGNSLWRFPLASYIDSTSICVGIIIHTALSERISSRLPTERYGTTFLSYTIRTALDNAYDYAMDVIFGVRVFSSLDRLYCWTGIYTMHELEPNT